MFFPGGLAGVDGRNIGEAGYDAIRKFVSQGGGYVGVCAGAYLALADGLNISKAFMEWTYHGKTSRGDGNCTLKLGTAGETLFKPYGVTQDAVVAQRFFYANGPTMKFRKGAGKPNDSYRKTLITYTSDSVPIEKNYTGPSAGKGLIAVATHRFTESNYFEFHGKKVPDEVRERNLGGRVLLSGPHPETDQMNFPARNGPPSAPEDVRAKLLQAYVKLAVKP